MVEPSPVGAGEVGALVEGVHLMHRHPAQLLGAGLDRVHDRARLAVGQGNDKHGAGLDQIEYRGGARRIRQRWTGHPGNLNQLGRMPAAR